MTAPILVNILYCRKTNNIFILSEHYIVIYLNNLHINNICNIFKLYIYITLITTGNGHWKCTLKYITLIHYSETKF